MQQIPAEWNKIEEHLQGIPGLDGKALAQLKMYYEEGEAKRGIHFFLIQYAAGEVIMAKGTTSDYAAVQLQGRVRVRDTAPPAPTMGRGCWEKPLARRLENLVLRQAATWPKDTPPRRGWLGWLGPMYRVMPALPLRLIDFAEHWLPASTAERLRDHVARSLYDRMTPVRRLERDLSDPNAALVASEGRPATPPVAIITIRDAANNVKPLEDRFMGITGTLWNQPRSVTLIADDDPDDGGKPCVMLLIKRKALEEIIKRSPRFYEQKMAEFMRSTLPALLAKNRLFRDRLFVAMIQTEELADSPDVIRSFCGAAVQSCLARPLTFWSWLWYPRVETEALSENWYQRTRTYANAKQQPILDDLWKLVQLRRSVDLEYRLHQLGRLWLLVHGPAAWALLVLMIEHAVMSMWYGGF